MEGIDKGLDGPYSSRRDAILKCYEAARKRGFVYFAIQNGGMCMGSKDAGKKYKMYGRATNCQNGKGGEDANNVYYILNRIGKTDLLLPILKLNS